MDLRKTKTVLLDVDGTIMNFGMGQRCAFTETCEKLGYPVTEESYLLFDGINKGYWKLFEKGEVEKNELIIRRFIDYFAKTGIDGDPYKTEEIYQELLGEQVFYIDGALEGVKYLHSKYDVHVVTNGVERTQKNRARKSGLINYIDKLFISEEVGYQKPQKEFFDYVFNHVSADRETTVIIGDTQSSDILGGKNAGIGTIWFNRKHEVGEIVPDAEITAWEEIYRIL